MSSTFKIKPAGRHIFTIGRDLIKDKYAAIIELVKNAYDADSQTCTVSLLPLKNNMGDKKIGIRVIVEDNGHGMTFETVTQKWMVPSTDHKIKCKMSPGGRPMQGKKGIGRYSASFIGDDLELETVDKDGNRTFLYLEWQEFEHASFLDDVNILIEASKINKKSGTKITIVGNEEHLQEWTEKQLKNLKSELKKLMPLTDRNEHNINDTARNFKIKLKLGDFDNNKYSNIDEVMEPYPLLDLYDYRISGVVSNNGDANLIFNNARIQKSPETLESFSIKLNQEKDKDYQSYCGEVNIDFRVFDRDSRSIDALIERGLSDRVTGEVVGKNEARAILNTNNGIGVYRHGFRIRPMGDAGYDWLSLDNERVQNPSLKVGSTQIIGFIHIQQEDKSGLEEKSARDGLKETAQYFGLIEIAKRVLQELETRRFIYRKNSGLGRSKINMNSKIEGLYDFVSLQKKIDAELDNLDVEKSKRLKINMLISSKEEESNKITNDLRRIIALYQGQATLGKIINIILHEGSKPLGYFKNQIPLIIKWSDKLKIQFDQELLQKILNRLTMIKLQGEIFANLFKKLDPLAARTRKSKKDFRIIAIINNVMDIFMTSLHSQKIITNIECDNNQIIYGWKEDYYIAFVNLVENSIYWLQNSSKLTKEISVKVYEENEFITIEYRDNGPGIEKELIESEVIFEPDFSTKTEGGTGLGLAIAGEAIGRNNGKLIAIDSNNGAYFKIKARGK